MKARLVLTLAILVAGFAKADFTINYNTTFSGTSPSSTSPYLTAAFADTALSNCLAGAVTCVSLTLTSSLENSSEFVTEWDFNNNTAGLTSLSFKAGATTGSFGLPTISPYSSNAYQADGDGLYDIMFNFQQGGGSSNRFDGTLDSIVYYIGGNVAFTADAFNVLSSPAGGSGPFVSAAHIQGITFGTQTCSGWITQGAGGNTGSSSCTPVPEPIHSGLFLTGALGGVMFLARKRLFGQA